MQASSAHPLLILKEFDIAFREVIGKTDEPVQAKSDICSAIGFQINNNELLIKNSYIEEILNADFQKNLSTVPGAKPWLMGLISLRGQPLPVIDLKQYLFNEKSLLAENSRLIVIKNGKYFCGLFLEHIYGLKQFSQTEDNSTIENLEKSTESTKRETPNASDRFSDNIKPFIDGTFNDNGKHWGNLSIPRLISDTDFANAAR